MPQSNPTRPPEPSRMPALEPNALVAPHAAAEDLPPSDSEAETERLHDSPVKKRASADELSPTDSASKRARRANPDPEPATPTVRARNGAAAGVAANGAAPAAGDGDDTGGTESGELDAHEREAGELEPAADDDDDAAGDAEDDDGDDPDDERGDDDDDEADDDDENENDEERVDAISALTEIEVEFADFRDKLHDQQIARFDLEIEMCTKGVHPELEQYHLQIRSEREKRLLRSRTLLAYQMRAILNHSHAGRCQVHQTHLKSCYTLRGELLGRVTREWYQINYERRAADRVAPDYGYVAHGVPHQVRRPTARSLGVRYHRGVPLPAAPAMICANDDERDEDLRQLGLR